MLKLQVGRTYRTECGALISVLACDPIDGTTLEYKCSDNFYRDEKGKILPVETFAVFAGPSIFDVKEEW